MRACDVRPPCRVLSGPGVCAPAFVGGAAVRAQRSRVRCAVLPGAVGWRSPPGTVHCPRQRPDGSCWWSADAVRGRAAQNTQRARLATFCASYSGLYINVLLRLTQVS